MFDASKCTPLERARIDLTQARLTHAQLGGMGPAVAVETAKILARAQARYDEVVKEAK